MSEPNIYNLQFIVYHLYLEMNIVGTNIMIDQMLFELASKLLSSLELDYILPDVCEHLVDNIPQAETCFISCRSGIDGQLHLRGQAGESNFKLFKRDANECFNSQSNMCRPHADGQDVLHIPLMATGFGVGVLTLIGHNLSEAESRILEAANFIAQAVRNGISYNNLLEERMIIEQVTREMRELYELTRSLSTAFKPDEVFERLLSGVAEIFSCEAHSLLIVDDHQGTIYTTYLGQEEPVFSKALHTRIVKNWEVLEKESIDIIECTTLTSAASEEPRFINKLKPDSKIKSWISAPLVHEGKSFGLLCVAAVNRNRFDPFHFEILYIVAGLGAKVIENAQLSARLQQLATIDGLTGIFNHRTFQERLEDQFNLAQRYDKPLSLIMMDIDHFKKFNDTHGHPIGDEVLKVVSSTLQKTLRDVDIVCRYGGEEFSVILPESNMESAIQVADRLREAIEQQVVIAGELELKVTISLGVSEYPFGGQSRREVLIEQADRMLYVAKLSGRNRVAGWSPDNEVRYVELKHNEK